MSVDLEEFARLKKEGERLQREADQAEGALKQIEKRLKKEFGCADVAAAKKKMAALAEEEAALEIQYQKELKRLRRDFPQLFPQG